MNHERVLCMGMDGLVVLNVLEEKIKCSLGYSVDRAGLRGCHVAS